MNIGSAVPVGEPDFCRDHALPTQKAGHPTASRTRCSTIIRRVLRRRVGQVAVGAAIRQQRDSSAGTVDRLRTFDDYRLADAATAPLGELTGLGTPAALS